MIRCAVTNGSMDMKKIVRLLALITICGFAASLLHATSNQYIYTILAKDGDVIDGNQLAFVDAPAINSAGQVVFTSHFFAEFTSPSLLTLDRVLAGPGRPPGARFTLAPQINNRGDVIFFGPLVGDVGSSLFTTRQLIARPGQVIDGKTLSIVQIAALNDSGKIVFLGLFSSAEAIVAESHIVIQAGDVIAGKTVSTFIQSIALNDAGTIAFVDAINNIVFTQHAVVAKAGDVIQGKTLDRMGSVSIANGGGVNGKHGDPGEVFFTASYDGGVGVGIFTSSRLLVHSGQVIDGQTLQSFSPKVNKRGDLIFNAGFASGLLGLCTPTTIVGIPGDVIGGKTVTAVKGGDINERGQIVFSVVFSDFSTAIVLATPVGSAH